MKCILCYLVCLALPVALHAATWTVDNNTSHPADFREIQEAVDAAALGDTILVAGSNEFYDGFDLTKRLIIKGERPSAVGMGTTVFGTVTLTEVFNDVSPDHLRNAAGSMLEGLEINSLLVVGPCAGVVIRRCSLVSIALQGCSGALITGCSVSQIELAGWATESGIYNGTGNNIVGTWANQISFGDPTHTLAENCVLGTYVGSNSQIHGPVTTLSITAGNGHVSAPFTLRNTILIGKTSPFFDTGANYAASNANATFDHCLLLSGATLPTGNENQSLPYNQFATVFVDATPGSTNPDGFVLKAGSPAIGSGIGGADLGMYGGFSPFVKDFIPALPRIHYLAVPPIVPDSTGLTFEVRAEARD